MTGELSTPLEIRAFTLAAQLHKDQQRKGSQIPYLSHLMAVSALVLEDGGSAAEAAAALLHDAAEDQGGRPTLALISQHCGSVVASLVEECSDSLLAIGQEKAPWRTRKLSVIRSLGTRSRGALLIIAADKLHNTRATLADQAMVGSRVWDRFAAGEEGFLWYHHSLLEQLKDLLPESRSVAQLDLELARMAKPSIDP
jgi:(p)ppGpp synthase/HD superfamily hydrolase